MSDTQPQSMKNKPVFIHMADVLRRLAKDLRIDRVDMDYATSRLKHEGMSFATKTLPAFARYVLQCCEAERVLDARNLSFTSFKSDRGVPRFMRGLLCRAVKGDASALYKIRQFCEYCFKLALEFEEQDLDVAAKTYLEVEEQVRKQEIDLQFVEDCRKIAERLFPRLTELDLSDIMTKNRPRYGPGNYFVDIINYSSPVPKEVLKKMNNNLAELPSHLKAYEGYYFPYRGMHPEDRRNYRRLRRTRYHLPYSKRTCRVCFVPKDSRGPRVISMEQLGLLKGQMAFNDFMSNFFEKRSKGHILFSTQQVHRDLARQSSINRSFATLDLKEASDRVSLSLVRKITRNFPVFRLATEHLRATHAILGEDRTRRTVKLSKYANMGSGLCFPTLGFIVYIVAVTSMSKLVGYEKARELAYVFGDDLIVPTAFYDYVVSGLRSCGLMVNLNKSFYKGFFRESCGGDYYHGIQVSPVRLRLSQAGLKRASSYRKGMIPLYTDHAVLQLERHCRELLAHGLFNLADYYYRQIEKSLGKLPFVHPDSPFLGRASGYKPTAEVTVYYKPVTRRSRNRGVCPYKGIAASLLSDGLGEDWCLTPLRRKVLLTKKRVVETSELACYGLTEEAMHTVLAI